MKSLRLIGGALLTSSSLAVFACEHPALPNIPQEGRIRGRAERMIKDDMLRYVTEMSVYVACIQAEREAAVGNEAPPLHLSLLATRNNVAVEELEAVRDVYEEKVGPIADLFFEQSSAESDRGHVVAVPVDRCPDLIENPSNPGTAPDAASRRTLRWVCQDAARPSPRPTP